MHDLQTIIARNNAVAAGLPDPLHKVSPEEIERVRVVNCGRRLARQIVERIEALAAQGDLPRKGKRRDGEALALWVGAAMLADAQDDKRLSEYLLKISALLIAIRGASAVEDIAAKPDETAAR